MFKKYSFLIFAGFISSGVVAEENASASDFYAFTKAESFSWSGANPVTAYFNLLVGPAPDKGNHAFTRNSFELGMGYKNFEISFIHRNDQNLDFSDGAREFAYLNKNNGFIPLDQSYDVDVWGNQYQASGLKFAYTWDLAETVKFRAAYSYLIGTELVSGYLGKDPQGAGGNVGYTIREVGGRDRRVLFGDLYTNLYYTDDPFFRREVDEPTARGFAFDVGLEWAITPQLTLAAQVDDLIGQLKWRDVPHTEAFATGDMFSIGEDGYADAVPSFQGTEDWGDYVQDLTRRTRVFLDYDWGRHWFEYNYDHYDVKDFHRLNYAWVHESQWGGKFGVEATTGAIELGLLTPAGNLTFTTDDTDLDNARTLGFSWDFYYRF